MSAAGGSRRSTVAAAARWSATALLAGALALGGSPALANPEPVPVDPQGGAPAQPADPGVATAPPADQGTTEPAPAPAPVSPPPTATGYVPNGNAGGPAVFSPVPADPAVVPQPPVNEALPVEVDERGPFAQQVSCDPVDRPGVVAFALLVTGHYDRPTWFGSRPCIDYASFHHDGRGLDWPLNAFDPADRQIADSVIVWLTDNDGEMADRFGLEYLIWNGLIWHGDGRGWQFYTGTPHTDHIHFSFTWDGAQMRTSWWTGVAVTEPDLGPCDVVPGQYAPLHQLPRVTACEQGALTAAPATGMQRVRPGESGGGVAMLQEQLGLPVSGVLDDRTRTELIAWQTEHDLPVTGIADDFTYAALLGWELGELPATVRPPERADWQTTAFTPHLRTTLAQGDTGEAVTVLQEFLGVETDGSFGPITAAALAEWEATVPVLQAQADRRAEDAAVVTPLTWLTAERTAHPTSAVRDLELEQGDLDRVADPDGTLRPEGDHAGGAVALLQGLLDLETDGSFGPMTAEAVRQVQQAAGLEVTGVVDGPTWVAVEQVALEAGTVEGAPGAAAARERREAERAAEEQAAAEHDASVAAAD
ncbi:peptidoglycan-binding domain-containing protein [Ornithinimicrobium kibberense]|uniref:Peptidoglycan-binding protein n=1 Tax=Ornithinimicrobium kibberense TaxID=282060 RepID=A0ABV5V2N3_9MICO|nr:peptidoglycan-binding protein [Ornithinimicrobium kibberense]